MQVPYDVQNDYALVSSKEWTFHTAKVQCCAWSPDNRRLATGALDTNVIVWDTQRSGEHPIIIKGKPFNKNRRVHLKSFAAEMRSCA